MSMKTLRLQLHYNTAEIIAIIELLDQVRDVIAETYFEDVQKMMQEQQHDNQNQCELPFDDPIDF